MATADDDERVRRSSAYRLIHHYRERAHAAIQRYNEATVNGGVSGDVRHDLAAAALDYYNALYEFRDEDALEDPWDERGIDWLEDAGEQTVEMESSLSRANGATTIEEVPLLQAVDPARLVQTMRELNDVANELGFSARIEESTPRTEITDEMIEKVEQWRQAQE